MKRKTALLVLFLIITMIPAIGFVGFSFMIVGTVLGNSGNVRILVHDDTLEVHGIRSGLSTSFSVYVGLLISCIIFVVGLFFLTRDLLAQRRKKQKMRESYTA
jgi:hypothetical protein